MRLTTALACAAIAPLLISAAEPLRLAPSTKWELNYGDHRCRLSRTFGAGDQAAELTIDSEILDRFDMAVWGKPFATGSARVRSRFLPVQAGWEGEEGLPGLTQDRVPGIVWSRVTLLPPDRIAIKEERAKQQARNRAKRPPARDPAEAAREKLEEQAFAAQATELQIGPKRSRQVVLVTGPMDRPLKALDKCVRDSMRAWGIDPDLEDKIARPVWAPHPHEWFSSDDYPVASAEKGTIADVRVRLLVDASGRPTNCTSFSRFADKSFDKVVCDAFIRRARFAPAELADGTKVPSYYATTVGFRVG